MRAALTALVAVLLLGWCETSFAASRPLLFGFNDTAANSQDDADRHVAAQHAVGATIVRHDLPWRVVQPRREEFRWAFMDRVHRAAEQRGMRVLAVLSSVPPWAAERSRLISPCLRDSFASDCQPPPARAALPALSSFIRAYVERYHSILGVEVFNEPNVAVYSWQPEADPEYYTDVLRVVAGAVRETRPGVRVISAGLGPTSAEVRGAMTVSDFLSRMYAAGAKGAFDGLGLHPYPGSTPPLATPGYRTLVDEVRGVRDGAGDGATPIWVTETGYTTTGPFAVDELRQAEWVPQLVGDALRRPEIEAVVVHTLLDLFSRFGPDSPESGFGILREDFSPKPVRAPLAAAVAAVKAERAPKKKAKRRKRRGHTRCGAAGARARVSVRRCSGS